MIRLSSVLFLILSLTVITACNSIRGSGNIISEPREVNGFHRLSLRGSGEAIITQGDRESVTVEADDNLLPHIRTEVKDGTLILGFKGGLGGFSFRPSRQIKFNVAMKEIAGLTVSGSGTLSAAEVDTDNLELAISGSGNIVVGSLTVQDLSATISGSGECELTGRVHEQHVRVTGSGEYDARELESAAADVRITGSGDATIWAHETLDVKVTGSGDVEYYGTPRIKQSITGSGTVKKQP